MGLVHIYTGDGKGKTTCSLGLILRSLGWGRKVCMIQFIKGYSEIGEAFFAKDNPNFTFIQVSTSYKRDIKECQVKQMKVDAEKSFEIAKEEIYSGKYDLIVLDEINNAINYDLLDINKVIDLIKNRPENIELVLTGRNAKAEIIELADYVTEMKLIKHPYQKGIYARESIDY